MFRVIVEDTEAKQVEYFCFDNIEVKYKTKPGKRTMFVAELCAYEGFTAETMQDAQYAAEAHAEEQERAEWGSDDSDDDDDGGDPENPGE